MSKRSKKSTDSHGPDALGAGTPAAPPVVAATAKAVDPDDISVPPAEDLDHDFFRASEAPPAVVRAAEPMIEPEARDPRIEQLMTAEAKRRRQHFTKYVKAAVAI